ncbi:MAG: MFS transporter [Chloroflexi bacterium]|nr:MFS transporter [Chloroflexota bacterium]
MPDPGARSAVGRSSGPRWFRWSGPSWPHAALPPLVLVVGAVMSLALLGDSLLYVALPAHAAELGLPLWAVGILLGANRIVRLATNVLAGRLFTRVGGRRPVIAAAVASAVSTAMYGLTPAFVPFVAARMIWGTCFSILRLGSFTVVLAASTAATRGRMIGVYQSVSRIGSVASLLLGSLLVEVIGYHATFILLGIATTPAILLTLLVPERAYHSAPSQASPPLHATSPAHPAATPASAHAPAHLGWRDRWLGSPRMVAVKCGMLANGFASQGVVLATLTLALSEVAGSTEGAAALGGLLVACRWGSDLLLAPWFGHLSDRIGRGRMIPCMLALEALAVFGLMLAGDRTMVIVATLAMFLTSTAMTAASDAAAGDLAPPDRRAEAMSGYADWIDIGSALGPPLAFLLAEWLGLFPSYGCTAALLLAVSGWFALTWQRAGAPAAATA